MASPSAAEPVIVIKGCRFPRHLFYDVPHHMWYQPLENGLVRVGMTAVAPALADRRIFAFTPKRIGREVEAGHACATIESSKWIGPARIAFDGTVVEVNEPLIDRPQALVDDMYGAGWMLVVRPTGNGWQAALVTGQAVEPAYAAWMNEQDFPGCPGEPGCTGEGE